MERSEKKRDGKRKTKPGARIFFCADSQLSPPKISPTFLPADEEEMVGRSVAKYWRQRYSLFSRYDEGIAMDEEGWFSVTPEAVAARHAELCRRVVVGGGGGAAGVVVDGFAGVGGNAIQFAKRGCHVVAVEIDPQRLSFARRNAEIYEVEDNIDFIVGDFLRLAPSLKGDVVFLSPPWGGPAYNALGNFTLDLLKPEDGYSIFQLSQRIAPNIIMFLPRTVDLSQVEELSWLSSPPLDFEIEENYVGGRLKGITACFGDLASRFG
ncbi:unnamed protein product [Spirodela intermedia]|uniref:Trimethylguanosine synthase n=1 Tax=Spirodela intermedia TaxID=51605 RepID=A0A7I8LFW8_SPIIN|nr:unnamed protein product [Spirodela intermedia]